MILNFIFVFRSIKKLNKIITSFMIVFSIQMILTGRLTFLEFIVGFSRNAKILTLFLTVPILGIVLKNEEYRVELENLYNKFFNTKGKLICFTSITTFALSIILNLASIPLIIKILESKKDILTKRILANTVLRNYFAVIYSSPNFICVALVLQYLNIDWISLLSIGFVISIATLVFNIVFVQVESIKVNYSVKELASSIKINNKILIQLASLSLLFVLVLILLNIYTDLHITIIVSMLSLLFPFIVFVSISKYLFFKKEITNYFTKEILRYKDEIAIFAVVGIFAVCIEKLNLSQYIFKFFSSFDNINFFVFSICSFIFLWITALVGIHPLIVITTLLTSIMPEFIGIDPIIYACILLAAYGMALISTPFSGTALLAAGIIEEDPWKVSICWNKLYILIYPCFVTVLLFIINNSLV